MLDGNVLCPYPRFPERYEDTPENPEPIITIQATFMVTGGLLLLFCVGIVNSSQNDENWI